MKVTFPDIVEISLEDVEVEIGGVWGTMWFMKMVVLLIFDCIERWCGCGGVGKVKIGNIHKLCWEAGISLAVKVFPWESVKTWKSRWFDSKFEGNKNFGSIIGGLGFKVEVGSIKKIKIWNKRLELSVISNKFDKRSKELTHCCK